ncbi:hypothetical protein DFH06DRAFT_1345128 [Mycena polygramma]|nr:hypothetical protein DFH06DRAFT_1345128 [Mycena polygramma]
MTSTTTAVQILGRLLQHDSLRDNLQFFHVQRFFEFTHRIWAEIVPPNEARPVTLPPLVAGFIASVLDLDCSVVQLTWHAFADLAEASHLAVQPVSLDDAFRIHARPYKIGAEPLLPPISSCLFCPSSPLKEPIIVEGRLFTLRRGVLPIFSKSLYCRGCHTRYYNNYFVRDAKQPNARREYYSKDPPLLLHVHESTYVDTELCRYFSIQMSQSQDLPVLDAFLLHSILRDKNSRQEILSLPHGGPQNHRYNEALAERNYRMAGTGQPMWAHACHRCVKIYQGEDGNWYRVTAGVHDGVTLFVRCCGIIISRATFFGSEGISGVKDFLKATFPPCYPGSMPSYIFYDNNCSFLKHLRACGETYFQDVGLPVDVFHFKCKHSEGDIFCQTHCNPACFRELFNSEGKWIFNSSAAEQANVWFGKFQNIVQDMPILKYNFFLDEMISLHNERTAADLQAQGHAPHLQSESLLRGGAPFISASSVSVASVSVL